MEHQPFETWITETAPLTKEQELALQGHLQSCAECRQLQAGWQTAHHQIRSVGMASPRPGFSHRFQASLAERRAQQQQLQIRRTLLGFSASALVLFLVLVGYLLATSSPIEWLVSGIDVSMRLLTGLSSTERFILSLFQVLPFSISLAIWILVSTGFVVLVAGWIFTIWRVTTQGVTNR
jgi:predicted anti-sigma-YlaC factor YlaD